MSQTRIIRTNDGFRVKIREDADKKLAKLGYWMEGATKRNIQANGQIDTGFMLNSVFTRVRYQGGSTYAGAGRMARGRNRVGRMAPQPGLPEDCAALVGVGAEYAVFQEMRRSFLYRAGEQMLAEAGRLMR